MTVSQTINQIMNNEYDIAFTVTDVPKGHFIAVIGNELPSGSSTRKIEIDVMQGGGWAQGGTSTIGSSLFVKDQSESSVHVIVKKDGNILAENTTNY